MYGIAWKLHEFGPGHWTNQIRKNASSPTIHDKLSLKNILNAANCSHYVTIYPAIEDMVRLPRTMVNG